MQRQHSSQATSTLGNTPNLNIGFLHQKGKPYTTKGQYGSDAYTQTTTTTSVGDRHTGALSKQGKSKIYKKHQTFGAIG